MPKADGSLYDSEIQILKATHTLQLGGGNRIVVDEYGEVHVIDASGAANADLQLAYLREIGSVQTLRINRESPPKALQGDVNTTYFEPTADDIIDSPSTNIVGSIFRAVFRRWP